jgi:hypothetical protein
VALGEAAVTGRAPRRRRQLDACRASHFDPRLLCPRARRRRRTRGSHAGSAPGRKVLDEFWPGARPRGCQCPVLEGFSRLDWPTTPAATDWTATKCG